MSKVTKTFQFGEREFTLETGEIARQADSAIIASCGDTTVMVTVVNKMSGQPRDFMPLTIDVEERTYAAGKIPGGFFRRRKFDALNVCKAFPNDNFVMPNLDRT